MSKYRNLGQAIEVSIEPWGYEKCSVIAFYNYDYDLSKYLVTMYFVHRDEQGQPDALVPVTRQMEDGSVQYTQPLSGEKGTIRSNICRVIQYMCKNKLIENFIYYGIDMADLFATEGGDVPEECCQ